MVVVRDPIPRNPLSFMVQPTSDGELLPLNAKEKRDAKSCTRRL